VNELLALRFGADEVEGAALLCAILAHGDIAYRLSDERYGQLLTVGLSTTTGKPCRQPNAWHDVLDTGKPMAPLPPRGLVTRVSDRPIPQVKVYQEDRAGVMQLVGDDQPLRWSR